MNQIEFYKLHPFKDKVFRLAKRLLISQRGSRGCYSRDFKLWSMKAF
jgi:hypothetical protein